MEDVSKKNSVPSTSLVVKLGDGGLKRVGVTEAAIHYPSEGWVIIPHGLKSKGLSSLTNLNLGKGNKIRAMIKLGPRKVSNKRVRKAIYPGVVSNTLI